MTVTVTFVTAIPSEPAFRRTQNVVVADSGPGLKVSDDPDWSGAPVPQGGVWFSDPVPEYKLNV